MYDNIPIFIILKILKATFNKTFSDSYSNFEFGIYYFSDGINMNNNQIID